MICKEKNCPGDVDERNCIQIKTGCQSMSEALFCGTCGRVHWPDGLPVFNRNGEKAFYDSKIGDLITRKECSQ